MATTTYIDQFAKIDGKTVEGCEALVNHPAFSHTRMGTGCWRECVWIYHFDQASPSGVICVGSTREDILAAARKPRCASPLSPTEPR